MKKPRKRLLSNKEIMLIKVGAACMLFLASSMFFFGNFFHTYHNGDPSSMQLDFREDVANWHPLLLTFFIGNLAVLVYIVFMLIKVFDKRFRDGDNLQIIYRIIFSMTILSIAIYSFMFHTEISVPFEIMTFAILSGMITWALPPIIDNDNAEF